MSTLYVDIVWHRFHLNFVSESFNRMWIILTSMFIESLQFWFCLSSIFLWCDCLCCCAPLFTGWSFSMGSAYQFHSWRVFVVVCALPCVCAVVALTFMPESPRFYLEVNSFEDTVVFGKCCITVLCHCHGLSVVIHFALNVPKQKDKENWEHLVIFQPCLTKIRGLIPKQAFICNCKMEA